MNCYVIISKAHFPFDKKGEVSFYDEIRIDTMLKG